MIMNKKGLKGRQQAGVRIDLCGNTNWADGPCDDSTDTVRGSRALQDHGSHQEDHDDRGLKGRQQAAVRIDLCGNTNWADGPCDDFTDTVRCSRALQDHGSHQEDHDNRGLKGRQQASPGQRPGNRCMHHNSPVRAEQRTFLCDAPSGLLHLCLLSQGVARG